MRFQIMPILWLKNIPGVGGLAPRSSPKRSIRTVGGHNSKQSLAEYFQRTFYNFLANIGGVRKGNFRYPTVIKRKLDKI